MCDCVCAWVFVIYSNLFLLKQKKKNLHHATANMHRTVIKLLDGEREATRIRAAEREEKVWQKQRTASNKTKTTHNTYTHTTDEWNRKWFLFDFRACIWIHMTAFSFFFLFGASITEADECVCYLCMIFLYHWMFSKRMVCVCKSQNRKNTLDERKKRHAQTNTLLVRKMHGTHWLCLAFFESFSCNFLYENGIQVWKKFIQPITQDTST